MEQQILKEILDVVLDVKKEVINIKEKVNELDEKVNQLDEKVNQLDEKVNQLDERVGKLETNQDIMRFEMHKMNQKIEYLLAEQKDTREIVSHAVNTFGKFMDETRRKCM